MELGALLGDRFEIEQQIANGGMGEVFRARDHVSNEVVAVNVLFNKEGHGSERFAREVELLSELSHPGIVRYVSHGEASSGERFLVMEWLDGEDLRGRLEREALTMIEAVTLATRVAEALGAAHARGVVHRDLKPSNLFLPGRRIERPATICARRSRPFMFSIWTPPLPAPISALAVRPRRSFE